MTLAAIQSRRRPEVASPVSQPESSDSKNRKEQSRQKIVETAAKAFNRHGVDGIGIADIMKQAGLTQGAFSGHFSSKEELLREALDDGFYLGFHPLDLALCCRGPMLKRHDSR